MAVIVPPVFSCAWFLRHQRSLLAALNTPVLGGELRAALCMAEAGRLVRFDPHAYTVRQDNRYVTEFRTGPEFAGLLRARFDGLWRAFHWFDHRIANPFVPAFNLGFDTFSRNPDKGQGGTTFDFSGGQAGRDLTWASIRTGTSYDNVDTGGVSSEITITSSATLNQWAALNRASATFDTTQLGQAAPVIVSAVASLMKSFSQDNLAVTPNIDMYAWLGPNSSNTFDGFTSDFGSTALSTGAVSWATWNALTDDTTYVDFTFGASALTNNLNQSGITKLAWRNANYDVANVAPAYSASKSSFLRWNSSDANIGGRGPKLVVTYTTPNMTPLNNLRPRAFAPGLAR
jgi:hypothetical protein